MSASILVPGECLLISLTWFGKSCHCHESEALVGLDIVMNIHLYKGTLPSSKYFLEWYIVTPFIPTRFFLFLLFMKSLRNNILIWCQLIWVVHHYFFFLSFSFLFILFSNNISQLQFPLPSLFQASHLPRTHCSSVTHQKREGMTTEHSITICNKTRHKR